MEMAAAMAHWRRVTRQPLHITSAAAQSSAPKPMTISWGQVYAGRRAWQQIQREAERNDDDAKREGQSDQDFASNAGCRTGVMHSQLAASSWLGAKGHCSRNGLILRPSVSPVDNSGAWPNA